MLTTVVTFLAYAALSVGLLWSFGALAYFPDWPKWARWMGCVALLLAVGVVLWQLKSPLRLVGFAGVVAVVAAMWFGLNRPSNQRVWADDQKFCAVAEIDSASGKVVIENFRSSEFGSDGKENVRWETRTFDLNSIRSVDYVVVPFSSWRGLAHTFLSFGFEDGDYLAISIEIRKEQGEDFSPMAGFYRNFESYYVIGDERDLIGVRTNIRHNDVYVYPMRVTTNVARDLLLSMLGEANELATTPRYYNSITNTCATGVLDHVNTLREKKIPRGLRTVLPGYSDAIAWEYDMIDFEGHTLEEARSRFQINSRSAFLEPDPGRTDVESSRQWSRQIRTVTE